MTINYTPPANPSGNAPTQFAANLAWDPSTLLDVAALLHFESDFTDERGTVWTAEPTGTPGDQPTITTSVQKFGVGSLNTKATSGWAGGGPQSKLVSARNAIFNPATDKWTLEAWVNLRSTDPLGGFPQPFCFSIGDFDGFNFAKGVQISLGYWLGDTPRQWQMDTVGSANTQTVIRAGEITGLTWYHIAVSHDSGEVQFFVDGELVGSTNNALQSIVGRIVLGYTVAAANNDSHYWRGYIDELRYTRGRVVYWDDDFTPPAAAFEEEASSYSVYRDGVRIATANDLEYVDSTVVPGTTYEYTFAAYDGVEDVSELSDPVTVAVPPDVTDVDTHITGFNDEVVYGGYFGGQLKGTTVACVGDNANKVKSCC